MNIVFLDAKTIGEDIDLSGYDKLGDSYKIWIFHNCRRGTESAPKMPMW